MKCPHCQNSSVLKNGKARLKDGTCVQRYGCQSCSGRFNKRTGTPMAGLRKNLYAKSVTGLQRPLTVQPIVHNWVRLHWGLTKGTTPAMAIGLYHQPVKMEELLC